MLKNAYTLYIIQSLASQSSPSMNNYENINLYPIFFLTVKTSLFEFIYLYTVQLANVLYTDVKISTAATKMRDNI